MSQQSAAAPPESGVRQRTRLAVVDAAIAVWARDWSAALADIADRAGVSRSTLHRYFPDRQSLVDAARDRAVEAMERSTGHALVGCTSAADELEALMRGLADVGDAIIYLFADPTRFTQVWKDEDDHGDLRRIVERAQAEGSVAADVHPDWVISVFYSLVYVAAESINSGTLPRHRAGEVSARAFFGGVRPTAGS